MTITRVPHVGPSAPRRWAAGRAPRTAAERQALLEALEQPGSWPDAAASLLAELGFRLIEPDQVAGDDSHLLVALRDRPTLRHFDPESVAYYAPYRTGAALTTFDRRSLAGRAGRIERTALWGQLHVLDRFPVENRFLSFGGDLRLATIDGDLTVVDLWSPAPIVRWGGHSQGTDALTEAIGAFFGRLMVPVDFVPGMEQKIDALLPEVLYRAFLIDAAERSARARRLGASGTQLDGWIASALTRARADGPACDAAQQLLVELELSSPTHATAGSQPAADERA